MRMFTIAAIAALMTAPAIAGDKAAAGIGGTVVSHSVTGGVAITGGIAGHGNTGFSSVENFQGATNYSEASGSIRFVDTGHGYGKGKGKSVDGIDVIVSGETVSVSEQVSQTRVIDRGYGTAGIGGGYAKSGGSAKVGGGFMAFGHENW